MISDWQHRTALLLGEKSIERLQKSHVLVVGLGGVGGHAAEMLCRAGIGNLTLVDGDKVDTTNRNRQLLALHTTEGKHKTEVMKERLLKINPEVNIEIITAFIKDEKITELFENKTYDYLIDAIDTLSPKVFLIAEALKHQIPVVSAMGAGGKLDPSKIQLSDISKTHQCPLAAAVRKRLRMQGISSGVKAIFSTEITSKHAIEKADNLENKQTNVGTVSYMPALFGCWCASVCIQELTDCAD